MRGFRSGRLRPISRPRTSCSPISNVAYICRRSRTATRASSPIRKLEARRFCLPAFVPWASPITSTTARRTSPHQSRRSTGLASRIRGPVQISPPHAPLRSSVVMGHGPHYSLPVESRKGKPIFYGLGNLTFNTGHLGRKHAGWVGMLVEMTIERGGMVDWHFRFVRSSNDNESYFCRLADEGEIFKDLAARSGKLGAILKPEDDRVRVVP